MADKNVILEGYMKKLKTMKKKYFVLFGDTKDMYAHLRYYDSEKKFKQSLNKRDGPNTKKCIILRDCFNINRRMDTRHSNVLALYTKEECFCIIFDIEEDLHKWLNSMLRLQKGTSLNANEPTPRPQFEHIWEVNIEKKGLGESKDLHGPYRLCISEKNLSFVKTGSHVSSNRDLDIIDVSLGSIRRYGATQCYFYLEIGRVSKTGAGELWMETADQLIAQNMYDTILKYAKHGKITEESTTVYHRDRSLSVNEASKPSTLQYKLGTDITHEIKPYNDSCHRERCDSLPSSNSSNSNKSKTINRPFSLCSRSPTTPSPLSPNSQTLSSKSDDDSSVTVDEVDGADDVSKNHKNISSSHSKMTILEETSEDISMSEKTQTNENEVVKISSESFPEKEGYLVMLPSTENIKRTEIRSRTSSFAEEVSSHFGYNQRFHLPDGFSSSASSVTSGTPSTDTRFSAFHLEKTFSHFSEDNDFVLRPTRTYSVGSKPENAKSKALDITNLEGHKSTTRTRAFSVGSKVKACLNDVNEKFESRDKTGRKAQTDKSTSVPTLTKNLKSGASDHVEIDFRSHTGSLNRRNFGFSPSNTSTSEYMEMHPSNNPVNIETPKNDKSDYVEMGINLMKPDRCSSKPIEIIKKKNDKFLTHETQNSSLIMDDISENETPNTIFALSLENFSTLDANLSEKVPDQQTHANLENIISEHDEGDYATLLPSTVSENKEGNVSCRQNYVDLYFPQQVGENVCNPKKEENTTKSTYAQIVFSDVQPK